MTSYGIIKLEDLCPALTGFFIITRKEEMTPIKGREIEHERGILEEESREIIDYLRGKILDGEEIFFQRALALYRGKLTEADFGRIQRKHCSFLPVTLIEEKERSHFLFPLIHSLAMKSTFMVAADGTVYLVDLRDHCLSIFSYPLANGKRYPLVGDITQDAHFWSRAWLDLKKETELEDGTRIIFPPIIHLKMPSEETGTMAAIVARLQKTLVSMDKLANGENLPDNNIEED